MDTTKIMATAKAWTALIGAVVTVLLATLPPDDTLWTVLSYVAALCTAVAVYRVPNRPA